MSDLHVDVCDYELAPTPEGAGAVVIAGDVRSKLVKRCLPWVEEHVVSRGLPTIYVPGNHEFYSENISTELLRARSAAREAGVHLLAEGETVVVDNVRFVGATLWTNYTVLGKDNAPWSQLAAMQMMSDHRAIRVGGQYRRWTANDAANAHLRQREAIAKALSEPWPGPTVVITHHAPHPNSLRSAEPRDLLDGAYASDLSALIEQYSPSLWIHGHIHEHKDYVAGRTRIVANPRGYVTQIRRWKQIVLQAEDTGHDPGFIVEV